MKFNIYIYGRTLKIDFREICTSQTGIADRSKSLIKQLLNTDVVSNGEISCTRYLFIREENQVLFGVGVNHLHHFDDIYKTDEAGRALRSFIGIIVDNSDFEKITSIPVDPDFYINLYLEQIKKVWDLEDRPKNRKLIISESMTIDTQDDWLPLNGTLSFNNDVRTSRLFGKNEEKTVISSLKNCMSSVLIGLNNEGHVISAAKRFKVFIPNALCLSTISTKMISLDNGQPISDKEFQPESVFQYENTLEHNKTNNDDNLMDIDWGDSDSCEIDSTDGFQKISNIPSEDNNILYTQDHQKPKKGFRLILMAVGTLSLAFVIGFLAGRCSKETSKSQQQSISGDQPEIMTTNDNDLSKTKK